MKEEIKEDKNKSASKGNKIPKPNKTGDQARDMFVTKFMAKL